MRTVHRPELPLLVLHLGGGVHRIPVAFEMPADLVDLESGDVGSFDVMVPLASLQPQNEFLHLPPDGRPPRGQQGQPSTDHFVDQE